MRSDPRILAALAGGLSSLLACAPDLDDLVGELDEWQGDYITYYSSPDMQVCKGTHEYVDEFVPFVASELGLAVPTGLRYFWLDSKDQDKTGCPDNSCQIEGDAISSAPGFLHEVVHAVAWHHSLNRWPFFTEGIAVAYDPWSGDGLGLRYLIPSMEGEPLTDPRPLMVLSSADEVPYGVAGSFVAFLLSRHGPKRFVDFIRRLPPSRNLEDLRRVFEGAFEREFDDEVEQFMNGAPCESEAFPVLVYDCSMPEVEWDGSARWSYSGAMDCEEGVILGGRGPENTWNSIKSVTLDVPSTGRYQFSVVSDGDVTVQIGACLGCPWEPRSFVVESGEFKDLDLSAGSYYVRMRGDSEETPHVDLLLFPKAGI